jgi:hypothetical protein
LQRRETGSRWLSVADWWLTVVELVVEKLVMRVVVAEAAERERERGGNCRNEGNGSWFFSNFGPEFLFPRAINSASIYKRWNWVISSAPG